MQLTRPLTTMSSDARPARVPGRAAAARLPHLPRRAWARSRASRSPPSDTTARERARCCSSSTRRPAGSRGSSCKATGVDLAAPGARHAVVSTTRATRGATACSAYDRELGEFECASVRLLEAGPVRAILRVESRYGSSTLREDYVLGADAPYVDVRVALDWHEQLKLLKLRYPTSVAAETATYETPYGHLERPASGDEEPGQAWVDVSGGGRGLTVVERREVRLRRARGGDIGISAVRSPVWAWHDPRELERRRRLRVHGPGPPDLPSSGSSRTPATGARPVSSRRAAELNQPPFALIETFHDGPLPQRASYAERRRRRRRRHGAEAAEDGDALRRARRTRPPAAPRPREIELPLATGRSRPSSARTRSRRSSCRAAAATCARPNLLEW